MSAGLISCPEALGQTSASRRILILGRIQLLMVVGLQSCLHAGSQLEAAPRSWRPPACLNMWPCPRAGYGSGILGISDFPLLPSPKENTLLFKDSGDHMELM